MPANSRWDLIRRLRVNVPTLDRCLPAVQRKLFIAAVVRGITVLVSQCTKTMFFCSGNYNCHAWPLCKHKTIKNFLSILVITTYNRHV